MSYTLLSPYLISIADSANKTIKEKYSIGASGKIESSIETDIPFRPTLHWKAKTHYIACEVADRPFPKSLKESFADIVTSAHPIRVIVAYPKDSTLNSKDYQEDIKQCKKYGIGYMSVDSNGKGDIEYSGLSLSLYIPFPKEFSNYKPQLKSIVSDCFEHYLLKGDPDVALQKVGQTIENLLYNTAAQAKKKSKFLYARFKPPKFIKQSVLIAEMIKENVLDVGILGRCKDFAKDRNSVSHKPKNIIEAKKIEKKLKENFITGIKILEDLPIEIQKKTYKVSP
jgi:hypothetical protein